MASTATIASAIIIAATNATSPFAIATSAFTCQDTAATPRTAASSAFSSSIVTVAVTTTTIFASAPAQHAVAVVTSVAFCTPATNSRASTSLTTCTCWKQRYVLVRSTCLQRCIGRLLPYCCPLVHLYM